MASDPIPSDLCKAFRRAIIELHDWTAGGPEPQVNVGQQAMTISAVCSLAMSFNDPMPDDVVQLLANVRGAPDHFSERSYSYGAGCLLKMIEGRQSQFK
jgi:hypothetical protein